MSQLLVIGGYATSGKDAIANVLVEELGWYKTYMSKPLEQALLTLDPFIPVNLEQGIFIRYTAFHASVGYDESKKNFEVRRLLQMLGTEIGRNMFGVDSWLNVVCREVSDALDDDKNVVVTGMRYLNELERFKTLGASTLWVHRPGVKPVNTHSSDNTLGYDHFEMQCMNVGTLKDLRDWAISNFKD